MPNRETPVEFESGGLALHGVLHRAAQARGTFVFCHPFAEEKKCAHRVLVEAGRALCAAGFSVLRFDYRGCGDSAGEFVETTPESWLADIGRAVALAGEDGAPVGLLGVRLGATLAALYAEQGAAGDSRPVERLILWEPVINGAQYVSQNLRRSQIKAMLTDANGFDAAQVRAAHEAETIDFDGYRVTQDARRQIEATKLDAAALAFSGPTLVLSISGREDPSGRAVSLAAKYRQGTVAGVRQEPFWNRIGLVDSGPAVEATLRWLEGLEAG